jgi:hypothetical protein
VQQWGEDAHAEAQKWRESDRGRYLLWMLGEHMYEAVRIVVNSKQESLELALEYLAMVGVCTHTRAGHNHHGVNTMHFISWRWPLAGVWRRHQVPARR